LYGYYILQPLIIARFTARERVFAVSDGWLSFQCSRD